MLIVSCASSANNTLARVVENSYSHDIKLFNFSLFVTEPSHDLFRLFFNIKNAYKFMLTLLKIRIRTNLANDFFLGRCQTTSWQMNFFLRFPYKVDSRLSLLRASRESFD